MNVTVFSMFVGFNGPDERINEFHSNKAALMNFLHASRLPGFSVCFTTGLYDGQEEPSAIVTVIAKDDQAEKICRILTRVAGHYKTACRQQEVWITSRKENLTII